MYRLDVYVPASHVDAVKAALFSEGAGSLGNYDSCCFSVDGAGQFRPLRGAQPYLGATGALEVVPEVKVEVIIPEVRLPAALKAMLKAHPYEMPAFQYWGVRLDANGITLKGNQRMWCCAPPTSSPVWRLAPLWLLTAASCGLIGYLIGEGHKWFPS